MPPSYKPLAAGIQGIPEEIFNNPGITFEDAQKQQALARAQELSNQMQEQNVRKNEALIGEQQRQLQQESQLRDALVSQYGGGNVDMNSFDPDAALITAQKIALQNGDLNTAIAIEKTQRERRAGKAEAAPLSDAQRELFQSQLGTQLPPGATMKDVNTLAALARTNAYTGIANDPLRARNRELNGILMEQRTTGSQIRPMTAPQVDQVNTLDEFSAKAENIVNTYMPYMTTNRGVRFLEAAVNPNSPEAGLNRELGLLAAILAKAHNSGALSDQDYDRALPLLKPEALDTNENIMFKVQRAMENNGVAKAVKLAGFQSGGFNVGGFTNKGGGQQPDLANYGAPQQQSLTPRQGGVPLNPDGTPLSREQFMALRNRGQ